MNCYVIRYTDALGSRMAIIDVENEAEAMLWPKLAHGPTWSGEVTELRSRADMSAKEWEAACSENDHYLMKA